MSEGPDATPEDAFRLLLGRFSEAISPGPTQFTAVKIHAGERGNRYYLRPARIMAVLNGLGLPRSQTFLTDTTVLYRGSRMSAPEYTVLAGEHGFGLPGTPPFIVADGLRGTDEVTVMLPSSCELDSARIARAIADADGMVVISHFKGHMLAGFGGAIKNLAMGCSSRGGKLVQHSSVRPSVRPERCTACGLCVAHCPEDALSVGEMESVELESSICSGCGECLQACPTGALGVNWNQESGVFHRRLAEYALAAASTSGDTRVYVNFLVDISSSCDCDSGAPPPFMDDIGVLASLDPVAIDQASFDLVREAELPESSPLAAKGAGAGTDKFALVWPGIRSQLQLEHAQSIGLGSRDYELLDVTRDGEPQGTSAGSSRSSR
jgi:uncharacterized Fe-S center protein